MSLWMRRVWLFFKAERGGSGGFSAATEEGQERSQNCGGKAPNDIPGGLIGEMASESFGHLIAGRVGGVHSHDHDDNTRDDENDTENALRTHRVSFKVKY